VARIASTAPRKCHDDWVTAYETMGWRYGPKLDFDAKTHPDMVEFDQLGWREQVKDAVFVALCEIARQWIIEDAETRGAATPERSHVR
jgi:hypothetical protein